MGAWGKLERFVQIFVGQDKLKLMNFKNNGDNLPQCLFMKKQKV